jgi:hypothetical protein
MEAGTHLTELNTSTLSGGIYWIKIEASNDIKTMKMVKTNLN